MLSVLFLYLHMTNKETNSTMKTILNITRETPFNEAIEIAMANGFTVKGLDHMESFDNKGNIKLDQILYSEDGGIKIINMQGTYNYTEFTTWKNN